MILDKLDEINIKDLSIERPGPRSGLPFDPVRHTTPEDWEGIKNCFYRIRRGASSVFAASVLAQETVLIFPDKRSELDLTPEFESLLILEAEHWIIEMDGGNFTKLALPLKLLYPNFRPEREYVDWNSERIWNEVIKGYVNNWQKSKDNIEATMSYQALARAKVLYPDKEIDFIDNTDLERLLTLVTQEGRLIPRLGLLTTGRVLFPGSSRFTLTQDDWSEIKKEVPKYKRDGNWIDYMHVAQAVTIITAGEIIISDQGVEIIPPGAKEDFNQPDIQLPLRRKF